MDFPRGARCSAIGLVLLVCAVVVPLSAEENPLAPAVESFTFHCQVPPAGTSVTTGLDMNMDMQMEISQGGQKMPPMGQKQVNSSQRRIEVLESDESGLTKVRVTVIKDVESSESMMTGVQEKVSPATGKTYVVEEKDKGEVHVTTEAGEPAPEDEAAEVMDVLNGDTWPGKLSRVFDGRTVKMGEEVDLSNEDPSILFDMEDAPPLDVETLSLTLVGTRMEGTVRWADFKVKVALSGEPQPGMKVRVDLEGDVSAQIDTCWPGSANLAGKLSLSGGDGVNFSISGGGPMTVKSTATYE